MASRPNRGPYPESYVPSDHGSRRWHDYTKPTAIVSTEDAKLDIIFVHGMGSRWQQTWCGADGSSWLDNLLPYEMPTTNILVSGFNSLSRIDGTLSSFSDGCEKFIEDLLAIRQDANRPIVFVGHSLGCLILQKALAKGSNLALRTATKGIIFFAAPHFGNDSKAWIKFRKQIGRLVDGNEAPAEINPATLKALGSINNEFQEWLNAQAFSHHVYRFYENLPVYRIGMIVERNECSVTNPDDYAISGDHLAMVKYDDSSDPHYQVVLKRLKTMKTWKDASATSCSVTQSQTMSMFSTFSAPTRTGTTESQLSCPDSREMILASDNKTVKLALALEDQGQYEEAEAKYREAIEEFEDTVGKDDRLTLYCMDKLAALLRDRSRYDEAAELSKKVVTARINQQGFENSATLSSVANLALIMRYQSRQQEAFSMLRNALENNDLRPLSTITRTRIVSVLAKIYRDQGAYDAAELLSRDVSRASAWWLGEDHPFTLNRQSDLSVAYSTHKVHNAYIIAEDLSRHCLDKLEKQLGRDHPNALRTSRRLGNYLRFQGDAATASKRLEMTFLRQKDQIGQHHPSTLSTLTSLAATSAMQGYIGEARRTLEEALVDLKEALGQDHPQTRWTTQAMSKLEGVNVDDDTETTADLDEETRKFFQSPSRIQLEVSLDPVPVFWNSSFPQETELINAINSDSEDTLKSTLAGMTSEDILGRGLRVAAYTGRQNMVRLLLERGAPVNSVSGYYGTAMQAAASAGHKEIVEYLLEMNADVNMQAGLLNTPLRTAVFRGRHEIAKLLLDNGADPNLHGESSSVLQVAVGRQDTELVRLLLERKADPNAPDHLFGSPLQEASFHGFNEIITLLISYGADPNFPGGLYGSAMQAALRASQRDTVKLLMESGADASSYNMLNAIMESGMDLVDVSFGRHTSDLFVMEPKFSSHANISRLRFSMRKEYRDSHGHHHHHHTQHTLEVRRKEEYTQRARTPPRDKTPTRERDGERDVSKTRRGLKHFKILGR